MSTVQTDTHPTPTPVLALVGPTASGKTAASLALAARWPIEIISADSALVYRGLDVGTAKPSAAERAAVPHHLIDVRDPWAPYSAAKFARDAARLVSEIRSRGHWPLIVGGTMLYLKALSEGFDALPAADPATRADLEHAAAARGWPAMHAELAQVDPVTAQRLAPGDSQRIQRALEVYRLTGQPLSMLTRQATGLRRGVVPIAYLSLEPGDRSWLHQRVEQRLEKMFATGLLDEVRHLRSDPRITPDLPAMRAVGYRQCWEALDLEASGSALDGVSLLERCTAATRQLAKRQLTWLRSVPGRTVVQADALQATDQIVECAFLHWGGGGGPLTP